MSKLIDLLGDMLLQPGGRGTSIGTSEALKGKTIGLYFSAHWCLPYHGFTLKFAELYNKMKVNDKAKDKEFIFIPSDNDEVSFNKWVKG